MLSQYFVGTKKKNFLLRAGTRGVEGDGTPCDSKGNQVESRKRTVHCLAIGQRTENPNTARIFCYENFVGAGEGAACKPKRVASK